MEGKYLYWLAGILEGEGSFLPGPPSNPNVPRISVMMTDEDVIGEIAGLFGRKYHKYVPSNSNHKPCFVVLLTGRKAIDLMTKLKPLMGKRRQAQIDRAIASYDPFAVQRRQENSRKFSDAEIDIAKGLIASGRSLRYAARELGAHHESLRRRLGA